MKFLIFGGNGFLGSFLYRYLKKNYSTYRVTRKKGVGIYAKQLNQKNILKILIKIKPDIIINTIALTDVDECELNKKKALYSNFKILKNITDVMKDNKKVFKNSFLIHVSTDQVYSGKGPHIEIGAKPKNYYAYTKLKSEKLLKDIKGCALRTNFLGKSKQHKNFNRWIENSVKTKNKILGYKNIFFSPLSMDTLIKNITLISQKKIPGVYNLGSTGGISKGEYVKRFLMKIYPKFNDFELINYKIPKKSKFAIRPHDMRLNSKKFVKRYKIKLPNTNFEVNKIINNFKND